MMLKKLILLTGLYTLLNGSLALAAIKLPKIFTDNMVLQRDKPLKIWGWADKGETITVNFNGQVVKTKTDATGKWLALLKPMVFGGPFDMKINGKADSKTLKNILLGDVWVCSGQSNMEWTLKDANNAQQEMAEANYPTIRHFLVTKAVSYTSQDDLPGGEWKECNSKNSGDFSAVGYFFARKLTKELNVPIGLLHTSWGGTNIETWISWDEMSAWGDYPKIDPQAYKKMVDEGEANMKRYKEALTKDAGMSEKWFEPVTDFSGWKKIELPKSWERSVIGNVDGIIWFEKEFEIDAAGASSQATVSLGPIDDADDTYINGKLIGQEYAWNKPRLYPVAAGTLKPGKNTIVVRVTDHQGGGGLTGNAQQIFIEAGGQKVSLAGEWRYKTSVLTTDYGVKDTGPNSFPSQLYNAMVEPVIKYAVKGVIWYQGESNAGQAYKYRTLFPKLINNWRSKWGDEFPFYWVQLANYMAPKEEPAGSAWAELREAQSMTLSLPQTGQAVIIDIGVANDIHPRNKQDVGYRLALAALQQTYKKDIVYTGPVYKSMKIEGDKIILSFTGSGLLAKSDKYGYLKGFSIAGNDEKFVWAKAYIEGDNVVVYSENCKQPVAVRYAWADNPDDANFYNKEGLPASPFRTDSWKGVTEGK